MPLPPLRAALVAALLLSSVPAALAADQTATPPAGASGATAAPPAASPAAPAAKPTDVVATVDGQPVTRGEFDAAVARLPQQYKSLADTPQGRRQILDNLIVTRLLYQRAKAQGFDKDAKVRGDVEAFAQQAAIMAMVQKMADGAADGVKEADARAYYDAHRDQFMKNPEQVRASHILVETEAEATKVRGELAAGKDFAETARTVSKDPASAARGGDLGFFSRTRMVPEFAEAAFALKQPGDLSPVVKTQFGYHVIRLTERKPAEPLAFPEVENQITAQLREEKQQATVEQYVNEVKGKASIVVDEARLTE
jgi:peptidyl-prolyl cis-trans isomerase C